MKRIFVIFLSVLILGSFSLSVQEEKPVIDCNYEMPAFSDNSALLIDARKVSDKFGNGSKVIGFNFKIVNYSKYKSVQVGTIRGFRTFTIDTKMGEPW